MEIPASIIDDIIKQCRLAWPDEACGLLTGPPGDGPVGWHPMDNVAEDPRYRYAMDEGKQLDAWRAAEAVGHKVFAIWHSHTVDGAEPSPEDVRHALDPDVWHLIVALRRADGPAEVRLWKVVDGVPAEQWLATS
jgi:proteasome lid subunit RPN8/RPN11